ncbi:MAG: BlaI/MecI/CopY family transcriptional regulator [Planctomycetes bacterium]|nr:BlaI/MecI/CopY family transcriptional regulator [Planctomycetota bacterium]
MTSSHELGDLQIAIMRVLWARGQATVAEVHAALESERGLAPTTIATMLTKMEKKGVVTHAVEGRKYVYRATVLEEDVQNSMVRALTERLFEGDVSALVNHLLTASEIDAQELAHLKALIEAKERERNDA